MYIYIYICIYTAGAQRVRPAVPTCRDELTVYMNNNILSICPLPPFPPSPLLPTKTIPIICKT